MLSTREGRLLLPLLQSPEQPQLQEQGQHGLVLVVLCHHQLQQGLLLQQQGQQGSATTRVGCH
jgi:hypothetical protein